MVGGLLSVQFIRHQQECLKCLTMSMWLLEENVRIKVKDRTLCSLYVKLILHVLDIIIQLISVRQKNTFSYELFNKEIFYCILNFLVVELASGEYGDNYIEQMIEKIDNGRVFRWTTLIENSNEIINCDPINLDINSTLLKSKCTSWQQFSILFKRESTKLYRNRVSLQN